MRPVFYIEMLQHVPNDPERPWNEERQRLTHGDTDVEVGFWMKVGLSLSLLEDGAVVNLLTCTSSSGSTSQLRQRFRQGTKSLP